jgi:hypothetical protein
MEQQARALDYGRASDQSSVREQSLQQQLQIQKQLAATCEARLNSMSRDMQTAQERLSALQASQGAQGKQEQELRTQLRQEKERAVIMTAKYNTLLQSSGKERDELRAQLDAAQSIIAQQNMDMDAVRRPHRYRVQALQAVATSLTATADGRESSVMTSLDHFPAALPRRATGHDAGINTSMQLISTSMNTSAGTDSADLDSRYLAHELDEEALLSQALARINNRRPYAQASTMYIASSAVLSLLCY